jgi:hypothetical protein
MSNDKKQKEARIPINKATLIDHGFTKLNDRVFYHGDIGFDFGIMKTAVVRHSDGNWELHRDITYIDELNDLYKSAKGKSFL